MSLAARTAAWLADHCGHHWTVDSIYRYHDCAEPPDHDTAHVYLCGETTPLEIPLDTRCDHCGAPAIVSAVMVDTASVDAATDLCLAHSFALLVEWLTAPAVDSTGETVGWELRRITP